MRRLAELDRQYHLAVSLHAPTEFLRNVLVPINERVGLGEVMDAADNYFRQSSRQVTFEYVMLKGVNDRAEDAQALAQLLERRKSHVNLIPYNPVSGLPFERPMPASIDRFVQTLRARRVSVSVRKTKGREIDAACGQLRRRVDNEAPGASESRFISTAGGQ
jgi:23S rRNA (adenine2503-C2)-methyltransferase